MVLVWLFVSVLCGAWGLALVLYLGYLFCRGLFGLTQAIAEMFRELFGRRRKPAGVYYSDTAYNPPRR